MLSKFIDRYLSSYLTTHDSSQTLHTLHITNNQYTRTMTEYPEVKGVQLEVDPLLKLLMNKDKPPKRTSTPPEVAYAVIDYIANVNKRECE